jgi:hypothetical protein
MPIFTVRFKDSQETVDVRESDSANEARNAIAEQWDIDFNLLEVVDASGQWVDSEGSLSPEEQAAFDEGRLPVV